MFSLGWRRVPAHAATARRLISDPSGRRELREELGVDLVPGPLHAVTWRPARRGSARFGFIFDMGSQQSLPIRLQATELSTWRWATPEEALPLLKPDVTAALTTAATGPTTAIYLEF